MTSVLSPAKETAKITSDLAEWIASLAFADVPAETLDFGKMLLLDSLGCLIAGTTNDAAKMVLRAVRRLSPPADMATAFLTSEKLSARDAALINGVTMYSVGLNGYHKPAMMHPGVSVIPALLAVGEWQNSPGKDVLAGLTAGYEVSTRIGRAMAPGYLERGFNGNGTIGAFAATASVARLIGLDAAQLKSAFGINGSQAAGLQEWHHDAALTVVFHAGRAAQNGIEACVLAQEGLTGPSTILEGREGFCQAYCEKPAMDEILRDLDHFAAFRETTVRPHFGATSTIAASSGAAELLRHLNAGAQDVAAVIVRTHSSHVAAHDLARPTTLQGARQSLQYNVAQAIGRGVLTRDIIESDLADPAVLAALPLVEIVSDDQIPRFGAEVTIRLKDGRSETRLNVAPLGDPANPLNWDQTVEKFLRLVAGAAAKVGRPFNEGAVQPVADAVAQLENYQMRDFVALLKAAVPGFDGE
jgi:2-methylcitrate dehydratase PrpD